MALSFEDLDDFFQLDEFAIPVQKGAVGLEITINAIFDAAAVLISDPYAPVNTPQPQLTCKTSDVADVIEGTRFVINRQEYTAFAPEEDGTGISTVRVLRGYS